jgi:hypothetical protein
VHLVAIAVVCLLIAACAPSDSTTVAPSTSTTEATTDRRSWASSEIELDRSNEHWLGAQGTRRRALCPTAPADPSRKEVPHGDFWSDL